MRIFVAVTDWDWFTLHASKSNVDEVNFWRPSPTATFKALQPGDLLPSDFIRLQTSSLVAGSSLASFNFRLIWQGRGFRSQTVYFKRLSAARMIPKHFLESIRYEIALRTALQFAPLFFESVFRYC
jgi:hypothetical protein